MTPQVELIEKAPNTYRCRLLVNDHVIDEGVIAPDGEGGLIAPPVRAMREHLMVTTERSIVLRTEDAAGAILESSIEFDQVEESELLVAPGPAVLRRVQEDIGRDERAPAALRIFLGLLLRVRLIVVPQETPELIMNEEQKPVQADPIVTQVSSLGSDNELLLADGDQVKLLPSWLRDPHPHSDAFLLVEEIARILRSSTKWVERHLTKRVRRYPLTKKKVLYRWGDILEWLTGHSFQPPAPSRKRPTADPLAERLAKAEAKWKLG